MTHVTTGVRHVARNRTSLAAAPLSLHQCSSLLLLLLLPLASAHVESHCSSCLTFSPPLSPLLLLSHDVDPGPQNLRPSQCHVTTSPPA
eukprot:700335-Rhodomonas_salina.3